MTPVDLVLIAIAALGFWFIIIRPSRASQRRVATLQSELAVGDRVVISAGILGTIRELGEEFVELEISPGVQITVARQVVIRSAPEQALEADEPSAAPDNQEG